MVKAALRGAMLLAALPMVSSCFDVRQVDPGYWIIDDFDSPDGGTRPNGGGAATGFERWGCWPQDKVPIDNGDCNVITTVDGHTALHVGATIEKPPIDYSERAEVATFAAPPIDLTFYDQLGFNAALVVEAPNLFENLNLKVQLTCDSVLAETDRGLEPTANPRVFTAFEPQHDGGWHRYDRLLEEFVVPQEDPPIVNKQHCLAHVNGIKITVDFNSQVTKASSRRVDLYVDEIWLEPRR